MVDLNVLMVGLSAGQAQTCQALLQAEFSGLQVVQLAGQDHWTEDYPAGGYQIGLVACPPDSLQALAFLTANNFGARAPVIALVDGFDPEWVNRLLAAGADRVIPFDLLESMLLECVVSLPSLGEGEPEHVGATIENSAVDLNANVQKLLGAQNFFESVLFNLPAMLVVLGLDGRIIVFNRRCEEVSGYTAMEVQGRLISDIFLLPEEKQGVQDAFEKLRQGQFPLNHQNCWLTKDGKIRQIIWSNAAGMLDEHGNVILIVGMGQDITVEVNQRNELRELEGRFERIFHASPIGIALVRFRDKTVLNANKNLLYVLGRNREEVVGRPADQIGLFPEQGAREILDLVARQGPLTNREWRVIGKGRRSLHVLVSLETIEWGRELVVMVIVRDITERVQSEEKIRRLNEELERRVLERTRALEAINREMQAEVEYRKAIESSSQRINQIIWELPEVVAMCDLGGWFQYLNKAGRKLYGLNEIEPISHISVYQTYPSDLVDRVRHEVSPQVLETGMWHGELELRLLDGRRIPIMQTILAHHNRSGEIEFFSTIIRDITEEKLVAEQINRAYQTEKEMGHVRASFFSMTSHQFRTPLSAILSSAELLEYYSDQWDPEKRQHHLRLIQEQVQLLNGMLNDILDIGHLEMKSTEVELQTVDVCDVVGRSVENCVAADGENHRFNFECVDYPLPALSAPHLIDRVFDNLLSNAIKYSPSGTQVDVCVRAKDGWAVIEVADTGIGIPADDLPLLYQPFYRAGNAGNVSGSGLGLMIVRRTLELIGGEIRIESRLNIGTRAEVRIPLRVGSE
jgi:PAS domain S-box-containing protein